MSLNFALSNALSGISTSSRMVEVVAANIANAQTDGYGRRLVELSAQTLGGRGAGVMIDGIIRVSDLVLLAERREAGAHLAAGQLRLSSLQRVEAAWGIEVDGASIDARVSALEEALIAAAAEPSSDLRLSMVVTRLNELGGTLRGNANIIQTERERADQRIAADVDALNIALGQIVALNSQIAQAKATGEDALALIDKRQQAIDKIATIVPVHEVERDRGVVALYTRTGLTLVDGRAAEVGFVPTPTIVADMTFSGGALNGLTLNGQPFPGTSSADRFSGGSLEASLALRDKILPDQQAALDAVARDLIERFQTPAVDPTLAPGDAALFTDGGASFDPLNEVGLAARIAVNGSVDPAMGGALFRLRDGVNAAGAGPVGAAGQLDAWLDALTEQRALGGGGVARGAAGHAAAASGDLGRARLTAEETVSFATAQFNGLRERELALGVDTDAEMKTLLLLEQSYAANAKIIETVEELFRRLMEI